jgi:YVTN family beta-propeller protein
MPTRFVNRTLLSTRRLTSWVCLGVLLTSMSAAPASRAQDAFVNFEGKQTSPIRLSPDGSRLFAVNTPDARLSVFDVSHPLSPILIAEIPVGLEPVSVNPLNADEAWVVNEVSDSVSLVSVSRNVVTGTLHVHDEPGDVVFGNGRAFISGGRKNQIVVVDLASHVILTNLTVQGQDPRALAVSPDGSKVYAAFALAGNGTTIVPASQAPAQPSPTNPALPSPPQVGLIVDASDPTWSGGSNPVIKYSMPDHDVVEIDTATLAVTRYFSHVGTVNLGLAVQPVTGDIWVANTEARNLIAFEPALRGRFAFNRVSRIDVTTGQVTHFDLNPNFTYANFPNLVELSNALAQPSALAFGLSGSNFYLTAFGTDRLARLNSSGEVLDRIELNPEAAGSGSSPRTKRGPRGLALSPGKAVYVLNRISNTISIVDPSKNAVVREIPTGSQDPTPEVIRQGRGFLYDAKLSGSGTVSCSTCHVDAEMDLLAWDLGDPAGEMVTNSITLAPGFPSAASAYHPMKGPMTTQTLRGLKGLDPLHWRGDRTNFLHFSAAFDTILGGPALSGEDMLAYRAFINTIQFQPNPNQNLDRTFPTAFPTRNGVGNAEAGRLTYINEAYQPTLNLRCNTCHALPTGTARVIVGAAALEESQDFKVPQLRSIYQKLNVDFAAGAQSLGGFGLIHDGIDPDLFTFLSRDVFGVFANDTVRKRNLDAFVQCFDTGTAPAVGYTRSVSLANVGASEVTQDWDLLESQVAATNIDLIVKGTIDGRSHGLIYDPASNLYRADQSSLGPFTREELVAKVQAGDVLNLMGVAPGTGQRMAVDRNENGILDADEPAPVLLIARRGDATVVSWSTNAAGFVLERTSLLPAPQWHPDTNPREIEGAEFAVTNAPTSTNLFFRLRGL